MNMLIKSVIVGILLTGTIYGSHEKKCNQTSFEPNNTVVKYYKFTGKWNTKQLENGCIELSTTDKSAFSNRVNFLIDSNRRDKIVQLGSLYIVVRYKDGEFIKATLRKPR